MDLSLTYHLCFGFSRVCVSCVWSATPCHPGGFAGPVMSWKCIIIGLGILLPPEMQPQEVAAWILQSSAGLPEPRQFLRRCKLAGALSLGFPAWPWSVSEGDLQEHSLAFSTVLAVLWFLESKKLKDPVSWMMHHYFMFHQERNLTINPVTCFLLH